MKCKLFLLSRRSKDEIEINEWLKTVPGINIEHVISSVCNSSSDILLTIFYSDRKDKLNNLNK
jgi:hypothetical protein